MRPASEDSSALHAQVRARFETEFGEPHHAAGADAHWRLRPHPHMTSINIVLNGDLRVPALWIFDPHDLEHGVVTASIACLSDADELIQQVHRRISRAASKRP